MKYALGLIAAGALVLPFTSLAADKKSDGFKPLFNGKNLDGLYIYLGKGPKNADTNRLVRIADGVLHMYRGKADGSPQQFGYISTEREYENYHLRFEYQWGTNRFGSRATVKRDAGVIFHMFGPDTVWPSGVECQVQEGDVGDIFTVNARVTTTVDPKTTNVISTVVTNASGEIRTNQLTRPVFLPADQGGQTLVQGGAGIRRVIRNPMLERSGWNTVEVIIRGGEATYLINGQVNNRVSDMERMLDGKWIPLRKGKIIFQLEGAEVFYRNIELKEFPASRQ